MSQPDRNPKGSQRAFTLDARVAPGPQVLTATGLVIAGSLLTFVLIAEDLLDGGGLISHDDAVLKWFVDHRSDTGIAIARLVSTLGSFGSLLTISAVFGWWMWHRGTRLLLAVSPMISLCVAGLASTAAKAWFNRPRPPIELHEAHVTLAAFPSGHAADAAGFFIAAATVYALARCASARTQLTAVLLGVLLATVVGISRLVLGVHWLSDVVAGWALGTATATATVTSSWWRCTRRGSTHT